LKKSACLVLITCILLALIGCSPNSEPEDPPEITIHRYVSAIRKADFSAQGREFDPLKYSQYDFEKFEFEGPYDSEGKRLILDSLLNYVAYAAEKLEYEIVKIEIEDDQALATVNFTYIDCRPYLEDSLMQFAVWGIGVSSRGAKITLEMIAKRYSDILKENIGKHDGKYIVETIEIPMIVRKGKWYIKEFTDDLINLRVMGTERMDKQLGEEDFFNNYYDQLTNPDKSSQ
jgi:hypothetical protein